MALIHTAPTCTSSISRYAVICDTCSSYDEAQSLAFFVNTVRAHDAAGETYYIRSRSELGGTLNLYLADKASPTGVLCAGFIKDTREARAALAGLAIQAGAY